MGALDGVRVLDVSRVLAGPYSAQLMADNGAEVIKVEGPEGDLNRAFPVALPDGESSNFQAVNRGKKGIVLNLKLSSARAVLDRLIEQSDVMIQSFLPKVAEKLGVDWERVHELNPDLIYVSISGYGAKGPLRDKPGYDTMVAAYSGIMSLTGEAGRPPSRPGVPTIDMSTGMLAYSGAVSALLARERGRARGQRVDVSLLETGVSLLSFHGVGHLQGDYEGAREGAGYSALAPYGAFKTKDGEIMLGAPTDAMFARACEALAAPELLEDPRFASNALRCENREAIDREIEARLVTRTTAEWTERLETAGVATSPINTLRTVLSDPQTLANDMVVAAPDGAGGTRRLLGLPFKLSETRGAPGSAPPKQGADTEAVLRDVLGMTAAEIDALAAEGAI